MVKVFGFKSCGVRDERGNALFLILIAVALFAALSYAITASGRGSGNVSREQAVIAASQATQFMSLVRNGVTRMIIFGVQPSSVDYNTTASGDGAVFARAGGGVEYRSVPANIGGATDWGFVDLNHASNGQYIKDIGTNTNVSGRDSFGGLANVSLAVCTAINNGLGLSSPPAVNSAITGPVATYSVGANVIDAYPGKPYACMDPEGDHVYVYYHALIER